MSSLITHAIWQEITTATKCCKSRCYIAVAYIGNGGSGMLPLPKGSKLVVDASKAAVGSGQTNPSELLILLKKGVEIYSYAGLHAKVFVIGSQLFIGSTNVSGRSQERLQEAAFHTRERAIVGEARDFVKSLCIEELRLEKDDLDKLCAIYKPPRVPQAKDVTKQDRIRGWIAYTEPCYIPDYAATAVKNGTKKLKDSSYSTKGYKYDYMYWPGRLGFRERDVFFRVHQTGRLKELYSESVVLFAERIENKNEHIVFYCTDKRHPRNFQSLSREIKKILNSEKDVKRINKVELNLLRQIT